jgi:ABC-2 type transport system permease protein
VTLVWMFLSGAVIPITFFPAWLETVARASPFASITQLPIEILLGKHTGAAMLGVLALQATWACVLWVAGRALLRAATRKLVVQGG